MVAYFRDTRTEYTIFSTHVWRAQSDKIQNVLLPMREKNLHSHATVCGRLKSHTPCTGTKSIVWTCATRAGGRRTLATRVKFAIRAAVVVVSRLTSCCKLHTLVWNRPHSALVTQYHIFASSTQDVKYKRRIRIFQEEENRDDRRITIGLMVHAQSDKSSSRY